MKMLHFTHVLAACVPNKENLIKWLVVAVSSAVAGFGLTTAVNAGFGSATLAVLWQGLRHTFGMSLGMANLITGVLMAVYIFLRQRRLLGIGTVIYLLVYSWAVDFFDRFSLTTASPWVNFCIMLAGLALLGVGTGVYAAMELGCGPYDGLCFAISDRRGWPLRYVRTAADFCCVAAGMAMGGKAGLCTVVTMLSMGSMVQGTVSAVGRITRPRADKAPQ